MLDAVLVSFHNGYDLHDSTIKITIFKSLGCFQE